MSVADAAPILAALFFIIIAARYTRAPAPGVRTRLRETPILLRDGGDQLRREIWRDRVEPAERDSPGDSVRPAASRSQHDGAGKRLLDISAATALLVVFAPLMIIVAIVIKFDSPGPILYRQRRIGFGGREFDMFKFRSMVVDAERNGAQWAAKDDQRVTRFGRLIRKTRFDEIPQALNILRGEMSFVGPRPERPEFVKILEREIENYHLRHVVRPGLTGWAQVKYVYGASVEDARVKLQYDLQYIRNFTLLLDCQIILRTVRVALFGIGSR